MEGREKVVVPFFAGSYAIWHKQHQHLLVIIKASTPFLQVEGLYIAAGEDPLQWADPTKVLSDGSKFSGSGFRVQSV